MSLPFMLFIIGLLSIASLVVLLGIIYVILLAAAQVEAIRNNLAMSRKE